MSLHENLYLMPKFPYGTAKFPAAPTGTLFAGWGALAQGDAVAPGVMPPTVDPNTVGVVAPPGPPGSAPPVVTTTVAPKTGGWTDIISASILNTATIYDPHRAGPRTVDPGEARRRAAQAAAAKAAADEKKALQAQIAALQGKPRVPNGLLLAGAAVIAVLVLRRRR